MESDAEDKIFSARERSIGSLDGALPTLSKDAAERANSSIPCGKARGVRRLSEMERLRIITCGEKPTGKDAAACTCAAASLLNLHLGIFSHLQARSCVTSCNLHHLIQKLLHCEVVNL